jgi:hypothetical protein
MPDELDRPNRDSQAVATAYDARKWPCGTDEFRGALPSRGGNARTAERRTTCGRWSWMSG